MALFVWNDSYSVSVKIIDEQHKKLIDLINDLHDAMLEGKAKERAGAIIDELIKYTVIHFSTEEKYFDEFNYPETAEHKKIHKEFVDKVSNFKRDFENGKIMLSMEIMKFLMDWLSSHIKGTDKKYTSFLNKNGIK